MEAREIKNKIALLINQFDYLIIVEKSDNTKALKILEAFNIIRQFSFGSPELKLSEKEMQMMIISIGNFSDEKIYIKWEGYQFFHISLAVINRELEIKLIKNPDYELSVISQDYYREIGTEYEYFNDLSYCLNKPLLKKADFHVRHILPAAFTAPDEGKYILIFPWEAGLIPNKLVDHINQQVDELWCPSEYIKSLHINSGVFQRKIQVIPNGIDLNVFKPLDKLSDVSLSKTTKKFKFLFVGGILFRKGLDILIEAYLSEFNNDDDVTLILKGLGQNTYYNSEILAKLLLNKDNVQAEVVFLDENLDSENLAKLYSECNAYVHPYRAEGFGMPIFEAMACGTVPIVTNYGPSLEYCNNQNSFLIDYFEKENIEQQTFIEPDIIHLRKLMREAYENPFLVKSKSEKAVKDIQSLSWDHIFSKIDSRFKFLNILPEYRNNRDFYIDYLAKQISENNDNTPLLKELESICEKYQYKEIYASERFIKGDYKASLNLYTELFNIEKDKNYIEKIYQILLFLGDKTTAEKIKRPHPNPLLN